MPARILEIIVSAEKRDVGGRAHLAHLPGQLNARNERHPDIRQKQIRLILLHQLQGVQPVARACHQPEAVILPRDHGAHTLPQLVLIIRDNHGIQVLSCHGNPRPFFPEQNSRAGSPAEREICTHYNRFGVIAQIFSSKDRKNPRIWPIWDPCGGFSCRVFQKEDRRSISRLGASTPSPSRIPYSSSKMRITSFQASIACG